MRAAYDLLQDAERRALYDMHGMDPTPNPNPNPNQGRELSPRIGALAQLPPRIRALPPDISAFWFSPLSAFPISLMKHTCENCRRVSLSRQWLLGGLSESS